MNWLLDPGLSGYMYCFLHLLRSLRKYTVTLSSFFSEKMRMKQMSTDDPKSLQLVLSAFFDKKCPVMSSLKVTVFKQ